MRLAPYDELNVIQEQIEEISANSQENLQGMQDSIIDLILDILILSYVYGTQDAADMLGLDIEPDPAAMEESIYREIDGMTFADRVGTHIGEDGQPDIPALIRLAESEMTWNYNNAGLWVAGRAEQQGRKVSKTWNTMLDDRVRETHSFLEGVTVPVNDAFYTYDGDSAMAPGGFTLAENNVGCRCYLSYS